MEELFKLLVWGTNYEEVPFSHVYPYPRGRYHHLHHKLTDAASLLKLRY